MSPAVAVEDQGLAAGQHAAAKADLGPAQRREAVVGGEARAGEALRQERRERLRGQLTRRPTETWITPVGGGKGRGEKRGDEGEGERQKEKHIRTEQMMRVGKAYN